MIVDCVAYYSIEEILPYPQYASGAKEDGKSIYKYTKASDTNPLLIIEQDIILSNGKGLKQGFYQVLLNDDCTFFLLAQSGKLKAKVPVISISQRKEMEQKPQKIKKKKPKKNYKGEDSKEFIHTKAQLKYDSLNNCYILFYERANTKATGVIKL